MASRSRSADDFLLAALSSGSGAGTLTRRAAAAARRRSGASAAALSLADLAMSVLTSSRTVASLELTRSSHGVKGGCSTCPLASAVSTTLAWKVVLPSRRCTTFEAASTSSITKITSLKPSLSGTSSPTMWYCWSNMMSISSWLVVIRAKGTFTMCRFVCCASALMSEVLPVPGGPCSRSPSLWGYPGMAYFPVLFLKCLRMPKIWSFSSKKSESKVFSSLSL
mmetsp:Transcript_24380/g.54978  ORF Transcript_24380/g.54978 Transcript_24380/m.54978 type:complete len:223 (-) Transcript_24380:746-1414(-)